MRKNLSNAIAHTSRILDLWLPMKIKYEQMPSLSVGIVYNGKLVYKKSFGYADLKSKKIATPKICYRIASISKVFTTIAIMQLVERKKLSLNDKIEKHLPWFKIENKKLNSKIITIKNLLSHSAGVCRDGYSNQWESDVFPNIKELKKSINNNFLVYKNDKLFKYSNFGFALLGQIIEKVSGTNYSDYVQKNIILRIGMKNTYFDFDKKNKNHLATGYSKVIPDKERIAFKHISTKAYASATGFISNVEDLGKFVSAFMDNKFVINTKSKSEMMKKRKRTSKRKEYYGFGLDICKIKNNEIFGHGGGFPGFVTQISFDPKNKLGVITLANTNKYEAGLINEGIFETIYKISKQISSDKLDFKNFEGIYESRWGTEVVAGVNNKLISFDVFANSPMNDNSAILIPERDNSFIIKFTNNFDSIGEIAEFMFSKKRNKADILNWAGHIYKRVNN